MQLMHPCASSCCCMVGCEMKPNKNQLLQDKIVELEHKLAETSAMLIHNLHKSAAALDKCSTDKMQGSGVILTISALGNKKIIDSTMIANGLSKETIQSLKADMIRSFEYTTALKPKL